MGGHTEAGPDQTTKRRRRGPAIALAVVVIGLAMFVSSPWSPLPHVAMVLDGCDQEALSVQLDELEAELVAEQPTLLHRGMDDHDRVTDAIVDACRLPPHHVHEFLPFHGEVMEMGPYDARPRPVSWLARFQFRRELAWHCGSADLMSEIGPLPPERRFEVAQERAADLVEVMAADETLDCHW